MHPGATDLPCRAGPHPWFSTLVSPTSSLVLGSKRKDGQGGVQGMWYQQLSEP